MDREAEARRDQALVAAEAAQDDMRQAATAAQAQQARLKQQMLQADKLLEQQQRMKEELTLELTGLHSKRDIALADAAQTQKRAMQLKAEVQTLETQAVSMDDMMNDSRRSLHHEEVRLQQRVGELTASLAVLQHAEAKARENSRQAELECAKTHECLAQLRTQAEQADLSLTEREAKDSHLAVARYKQLSAHLQQLQDQCQEAEAELRVHEVHEPQQREALAALDALLAQVFYRY